MVNLVWVRLLIIYEIVNLPLIRINSNPTIKINKMKTLKFICISLMINSITFGQDYYKDFKKYLNEGDTIKQLELLKSWEITNSGDPELYTSFFNYYFNKSKDEKISVSTQKYGDKNFTITDSTGQIVGYLGSKILFKEKEFSLGISKISEGINLFPNRLDMRFGKIYALGQVEDWNNFTKEIIQAIDYSTVNNNEWTWTLNYKKENGKDYFLSSIQDYQVQLYNTGNDSLLVNMRLIANEILQYYPEHVESLSNLSVTYLLVGDYDKGLEPLLKAEKINPEDYIVLSNIAQGYKLKGDKAKAIEYYEKTMKYGDSQAKEFAKQQIEELKK